MSDLSQALKKGTLLILETGEYSDRNWSGPFRMLKDATKQELSDAFRKDVPREEGDNYYSSNQSADGFIAWIVTSGYAEDVEGVEEWHVGSYCEFEP